MDLGIAGNTALVTASSSGLGKASGMALAREGANVVLNGRDEERLLSAVAEVDAAGTGDVHGIVGDLTNSGDITNLVAETVDMFGGLDHLVTSAGGPPGGEFFDIPQAAWYEAFDLLVMSVVQLVHEAEPYLRSGAGTIVTITSRSVKEAIETLVLSNAVRMGVIGLGKTLARECGPDIRVNSVLPDAIDTERLAELIESGVQSGEFDSMEAARQAHADGIPVGRLGSPQELGDMVAFLSSERAAFINGAAIPIDGGRSRSNV